MPDDRAPDPRRVRALFDAADQVPIAEREAFVRRQAGADAALAKEVLSLLRVAEVAQTADLNAAGQAGLAQAREAAAPRPTDGVQSTATDELLRRLSAAPKLDTNRYTLEGEIGRGGMGAVLCMHDRHLNRRLAMKVLLDRQVFDQEDQKLAHQLLGRFLEEAQVTSQLDHPGVVPVHELGLDQNGKVYFTMRLVHGSTAGEIFRQAREEREGWTRTRALEVVLKVCDTMAFAHYRGVLHRDLKPSNVMVGRFGEVYVMDWGLAKVLRQPEDREGSPVQSSELQLETARRLDASSDQQSSMATLPAQKLGTPCAVAVGDVDGDGRQEVAFLVKSHRDGAEHVEVCHWDITGETASILSLPSDRASIVAIAAHPDVDGDGRPEVCIAIHDLMQRHDSVRVCSATGATLSSADIPFPYRIKGLANGGDLDGDDIPDLAVLTEDGALFAMKQDGLPLFAYYSTARCLGAPFDRNGDGHAELAVGLERDGRVVVLGRRR